MMPSSCFACPLCCWTRLSTTLKTSSSIMLKALTKPLLSPFKALFFKEGCDFFRMKYGISQVSAIKQAAVYGKIHAQIVGVSHITGVIAHEYFIPTQAMVMNGRIISQKRINFKNTRCTTLPGLAKATRVASSICVCMIFDAFSRIAEVRCLNGITGSPSWSMSIMNSSKASSKRACAQASQSE